ncbi:hypothetical protein [Mesorhizobium sp. M00.F.Ca.ET.216.01.1.1]|uniref:hypothetical protein n=1 Tax=Mesorhizobium sp. M00.F.Ca.ET.216.01.1.1 TaxID=2500528 RepID=UPI000FDA9639|nr:hypothetical protein [Mesorhizobium sp. M00.F.Ca.ET.216.01.1.1]TGQ29032.1 hypothetical protein EN859_033925 [Mesorhizobium sp. M00.F.Ca.ET.216.01.1.1]
MAWEITGINIGDEVTLTVTVLKMLDDGRASVSIQSYGFPYSIPAAKKTQPGDELQLRGKVTHVDEEDQKVTVKAGGLITDGDTITDWTPVPRKKAAFRDEAD